MLAGDPLRNGETQTRPTLGPSGGGTIKALEDMRSHIRGNSRASIADAEHRLTLIVDGTHRDRAASRRVLQAILAEDQQQLLQRVGVADHLNSIDSAEAGRHPAFQE